MNSRFHYNYLEISGKRRQIQYVLGKLPMITTLPGMNGREKNSCGLIDKKRKCTNAHKDGKHIDRVISYSCGKVGCKICWYDRIKSLSNDIYTRMKQINKVAGPELMHTKMRHFSITPPDPNTLNESQYHLKELGKYIFQMAGTSDGHTRLYNIVKRILIEQGFVAGNIVYHPYRVKDQELYRSNQLLPASQKRDLWRDETVEKEFYPHFHVIGGGYIKANSDKFKEMYGWQYHNHSFIPGTKAEDRHVSTLRYELGHAGVCSEEGKSRIKNLSRWFGLFSQARLEVQKIEHEEDDLCDCGSPVHDYNPAVMEPIHSGELCILSKRTVKFEEGRYQYLDYDDNCWRDIECWEDMGQHTKKYTEVIWSIKPETYVIIQRYFHDDLWKSYSSSEKRLWEISFNSKGTRIGRKEIRYGLYHLERPRQRKNKDPLPRNCIEYKGVIMRPARRMK